MAFRIVLSSSIESPFKQKVNNHSVFISGYSDETNKVNALNHFIINELQAIDNTLYNKYGLKSNAQKVSPSSINRAFQKEGEGAGCAISFANLICTFIEGKSTSLKEYISNNNLKKVNFFCVHEGFQKEFDKLFEIENPAPALVGKQKIVKDKPPQNMNSNRNIILISITILIFLLLGYWFIETRGGKDNNGSHIEVDENNGTISTVNNTTNNIDNSTSSAQTENNYFNSKVENTTENNSIMDQVDVPKPDISLSITKLEFDGRNLEYTIRIYKSGVKEGFNINLQLYSSSVSFLVVSNKYISPDNYDYIDVSDIINVCNSNLKDGYYYFGLDIDPMDKIEESNEQNNVKSIPNDLFKLECTLKKTSNSNSVQPTVNTTNTAKANNQVAAPVTYGFVKIVNQYSEALNLTVFDPKDEYWGYHQKLSLQPNEVKYLYEVPKGGLGYKGHFASTKYPHHLNYDREGTIYVSPGDTFLVEIR